MVKNKQSQLPWSAKHSFGFERKGSTTIGGVSSGGSNPHYREFIRQRKNATTSLSATYVNAESTGGQVGVYSTWGWWRPGSKSVFEGWDGTWNPQEIYRLPTVTPPSALNSVNSKFWRQAESAISAFKAQVAAGESRQTAGMIVNRANTLVNSMVRYCGQARKIRKDILRCLSKQGRRRLLKDLNNLYLEYTYGWVPLSSDIRQAVQAFEQTFDSSPSRRINCSSSNEYTDSRPDFYWYDGQRLGFSCSMSVRHSARYSLKAAVALSQAGSANRHVDSFGLGLRSFAPSAWELLPWSFVIDYFTNVGDIIAASTVSDARIIYSSLARIETYEVKEHSRPVAWQGSSDPWTRVDSYVGSFKTSYTKTTITRSDYGPQFPLLELKAPSLKQTLNLGSLLLQRLL